MKYILRNDTVIPRQEALVDIDDRGYQFGDGIYEVVRLYEGKTFLMAEHLVRLRRSAAELGIGLGFSDECLAGRLSELAQKEPVHTGSIYVQVTRGVHARIQEFPPGELPSELTAYIRALPRPLEKIEIGVDAVVIPDIRWLRCDIKCLNLIPNILARQQAKGHGCYEAIQHRDGKVTEGAFSNVFIVCGGTVFTHPEGNLVLSGITRAHVLDLCEQAGIPVEEQSFTVEELFAADEVFITSTTNEVMPVVNVDDRPIGRGRPGETVRRIQALYEASFLEAAHRAGQNGNKPVVVK